MQKGLGEVDEDQQALQVCGAELQTDTMKRDDIALGVWESVSRSDLSELTFWWEVEGIRLKV